MFNLHRFTVLILLPTAAVLAGRGGGESPTVTPKSADDLPTATPRSTWPADEPSPTPSSNSQASEQRTPKGLSTAFAFP